MTQTFAKLKIGRAALKLKAKLRFPGQIFGGQHITATTVNGVCTVSFSFTDWLQFASAPDPANTYSPVWNALTGSSFLVPLSAIAQSKVTKILTGAGAFASPYAALPTDEVLIVKQGAAAAFTINVDWSLRKKALTVVANDTPANFANITITPTAGQTQMGTVNYSYVIDGPGGNVTLSPLPDNTGAY